MKSKNEELSAILPKTIKSKNEELSATLPKIIIISKNEELSATLTREDNYQTCPCSFHMSCKVGKPSALLPPYIRFSHYPCNAGYLS